MPDTHDSKPFVFTRGPLILSLESVFWHWQRYPSRRVAPVTPPLHETARPRELEDPFRKGHGHVFRLPLTRRGVVLGFWVPADGVVLDEEESGKLLEAVEGAHIPGITATEIKAWATTRNWSWLELLVRRYPWLGRIVERMTGSGVDTETYYLNVPVAEADQVLDDPRVRPWIDAPVIDMEEARVRGQGKDAQIIPSWWNTEDPLEEQQR